jgi:hypothetical protein
MASLNYPCDEGVVRSKGAEAPCSFTAEEAGRAGEETAPA